MLSDYAQKTLDVLWTMPANTAVYFEKDSDVAYSARQMYDEIIAETPLAQGFLNLWLLLELI